MESTTTYDDKDNSEFLEYKKFVIIGDKEVGKTTFVKRLMKKDFELGYNQSAGNF